MLLFDLGVCLGMLVLVFDWFNSFSIRLTVSWLLAGLVFLFGVVSRLAFEVIMWVNGGFIDLPVITLGFLLVCLCWV